MARLWSQCHRVAPGPTDDRASFTRSVKRERGPDVRVVIMGSGRTGSRLASLLDEAGQDVTVIDWNAAQFARLPDAFSGDVIQGNGVDQDVLREAGIEGADVFIAATSGDNRNIMASQIAQQVFHVPKVISRIKDPDRAELYASLGIEVDCRTKEGAKILLDLIESLS